jgi:hypothetical protein
MRVPASTEFSCQVKIHRTAAAKNNRLGTAAHVASLLAG